MNKKFFYIIIILVIAILAGCQKDTGPTMISVDETPIRKSATPNESSKVLTLTPEPSHTPTEKPLAQKESYVYIEDLEFDEGDTTIFYGYWNFSGNEKPFKIGDQAYNKGIGMYVKGRKIVDDTGFVSFKWKLDRQYSRLSFDLGCERTMQYDIEAEYGTYNIVVYADSEMIWDSGVHDYEHVVLNQELDIPDEAESITIELTQTKGARGTLNIIMGSFKIYYYE